jgi:hypothetical protein
MQVIKSRAERKALDDLKKARQDGTGRPSTMGK